jgi:hypothetical protein
VGPDELVALLLEGLGLGRRDHVLGRPEPEGRGLLVRARLEARPELLEVRDAGRRARGFLVALGAAVVGAGRDGLERPRRRDLLALLPREAAGPGEQRRRLRERRRDARLRRNQIFNPTSMCA